MGSLHGVLGENYTPLFQQFTNARSPNKPRLIPSLPHF